VVGARARGTVKRRFSSMVTIMVGLSHPAGSMVNHAANVTPGRNRRSTARQLQSTSRRRLGSLHCSTAAKWTCCPGQRGCCPPPR
jgi:hypothetical protein